MWLFFRYFDGYDKLIRWCIVIYGVIDGFFCIVVFFKVFINNEVLIVLDLFVGVINIYYYFRRICIDYGIENVDVVRFMLI